MNPFLHHRFLRYAPGHLASAKFSLQVCAGLACADEADEV